MYGNYIDTSFKNNVAHIRPYLGVLLVASMALGVMFVLVNATSELTQTVYSAPPRGIERSIALKQKGTIRYGDTVSYTATVPGASANDSHLYVTTVCFEGDAMVFQKSTTPQERVYLYDQMGDGPEWNGQPAACSATLMYRTIGTAEVYLIDSLSFDVEARSY